MWQQIPQVILRYPYTGMDYQHDLDADTIFGVVLQMWDPEDER
jgi:hypothetical protein